MRARVREGLEAEDVVDVAARARRGGDAEAQVPQPRRAARRHAVREVEVGADAPAVPIPLVEEDADPPARRDDARPRRVRVAEVVAVRVVAQQARVALRAPQLRREVLRVPREAVRRDDADLEQAPTKSDGIDLPGAISTKNNWLSLRAGARVSKRTPTPLNLSVLPKLGPRAKPFAASQSARPSPRSSTGARPLTRNLSTTLRRSLAAAAPPSGKLDQSAPTDLPFSGVSRAKLCSTSVSPKAVHLRRRARCPVFRDTVPAGTREDALVGDRPPHRVRRHRHEGRHEGVEG